MSWPRLALLALTALLASSPALAQEPSREREAPMVPSAKPDIVAGERRTPHFVIRHTAAATRSAQALADKLERARADFAARLGRDWPGVTEVRLGVGRDELEALALPGGKPPSWASALAYPSHNIILLEARSLTTPEGEATLRHELSHVALGQLGDDWPRWFQEGLATYMTGEHRLSLQHYTTLFHGVQQDRILSLDDLTHGWPERLDDVQLAYAQSTAFIDWLQDRYGPERFGALLDGVAAGEPFPTAFAKAFRVSLSLEEADWRKTLPSRYRWMPLVTLGSTVWAIAALVCVLAYVRYRRQVSRRRAAQALEELAEDATSGITADAEAPEPDKPTLH